MEITYQNTRADLDARFDFLLTETSEGKRIGKRAFTFQQFWTIIVGTWFGAVIWGLSGDFSISAIITIFLLALGELVIFLFSSFKPKYYYGKKAYLNELKYWSEKDWERFLLPKKLKISTDCLEESCHICLHRWRWSVVDHVHMNDSFIFLVIGNCHVICLPKNAFSSKESYQKFGEELKTTYLTVKNQPIGSHVNDLSL